jgi:hypothetical protein
MNSDGITTDRMTFSGIWTIGYGPVASTDGLGPSEGTDGAAMLGVEKLGLGSTELVGDGVAVALAPHAARSKQAAASTLQSLNDRLPVDRVGIVNLVSSTTRFRKQEDRVASHATYRQVCPAAAYSRITRTRGDRRFGVR